MFNVTKTLQFERLDCGSVKIYFIGANPEYYDCKPVPEEQIVTADTWASIIASMSATADEGLVHDVAKAIHGGSFGHQDSPNATCGYCGL